MQTITDHCRNTLAIALMIMTASAIMVNAATFTVNLTSNAGDLTCDATCTLRDAVDDANNIAGSDTIVFDAVVFSSPQTITLASVITINGVNDTLTITGPGANLLTLSGNNAVQVFSISAGEITSISGMTITTAVGGAVANGATLTVTNIIFDANTDSNGGAITNSGVELTVTGCTFSNNTNTGPSVSGSGGAAIHNTALATINSSTFTNNSTIVSAQGGAIDNRGTMTINDSTFTGNTTVGTGQNAFGGAISVQGGGQLTINNSVLTGNSSKKQGGAIYFQPNAGTPVLLINNSTFTNNISNSDNTTDGDGGALFLTGTGSVTITGSTFTGNSANAGRTGGAIAVSVPMTMSNSTVSGNTAGSNGGGIYASGVSTTIVNITNSTIVNNTATVNGGGVQRASTTNPVNLRNSIVANNIANGGTSPDVLGTINSNGFNLIRNTTGATFTGDTSTNITGQDPLLGPLQNNGGLTFTHALLVGSPAIDQGESSGATTDQRGFSRPLETATPNAPGGDGADMGAFEALIPSAAEVLVSGRVLTLDGRGLRNAIVWLTDIQGAVRSARTSTFGYFRFEDVPVGETYVIGVSSKQYRFTPRIIAVSDEISDLILIPESQNQKPSSGKLSQP